MTPAWFDVQLGRMVVLRNMPMDSSEYWPVFAQIPEAIVMRGINHAIKSRTFFPTPAELLIDCDTARARTPEPEPDRPHGDGFTATIRNPFGGKNISVQVDREWKHYCDHCSDTGHRTRWCGAFTDPNRKPWVDVGACAWKREHGTHEWAERCVCWDTNPALLRRRDREATYAKAAAK